MEAKQFRNIGYLLHKLQESDLSYTSEKIKKIKEGFDSSTPINYQLIGQIEREYDLADDANCLKELYSILMPVVEEYEGAFNYLQDKQRLLKNKPANLTLSGLWVNFQQKYEFNPSHNHD